MIVGISYYQLLSWFIIYSFLGWCLEVVFHAVTMGKIVNRGFLNGPICPVYGFGAVAILVGGQSFDTAGIVNMNPVIVFMAGMILATLIELIAGWLLDIIFHARYWDYTKEPFNFKGYICLRFSLLWGLGTLIIARVIHPIIAHVGDISVPTRLSWILLIIIYIVFIVDVIITTSVLIGINRKLKQINELREKMRVVSDTMSTSLGGSALMTTQAIQGGRVQAHIARTTVTDALVEKADAAQDMYYNTKSSIEKQINEIRSGMMKHSHSMLKRVLTAFPTLMHDDYQDLIEEFRQELKKLSKIEKS